MNKYQVITRLVGDDHEFMIEADIYQRGVFIDFKTKGVVVASFNRSDVVAIILQQV